jgi:transposase
LRKKSGKVSGGQNGHEGKTLAQTSHPHDVIRHALQTCPDCGVCLETQECLRLSARQVFDIPLPEVRVTEHQIEYKHCRKCKKTVHSAFPKTVEAPVQYGPNIRSWSVYYQNQHYIPQDRLQHLFLDLYGLSISTATLASYNEKSHHKLKLFEEQTLALVQKAPVKNLDETGYRIEGKTAWLHTASTPRATYYHVSVKRKSLLSGLTGTVVHDHWKPYLGLQDVHHALCNQHHMRELMALMTQDQPEPWAERMLKFLTLALRCRHYYGKEPIPPRRLEILYTLYRRQITLGLSWHETLTPLPIKRVSQPKRRKGHNLLLRLQAYQEDVLRFLIDPDVPFTNNLAEQDLRMMKCKQKISGGFRSFHGSEYFARIRGFISTARKQKWNILESLTTIFLPDSILPAPS